MSTYRIKLIAAFCAIAAFAGSNAVRADHHKSPASDHATSAAAVGASSHEMSDKGASDRMSEKAGMSEKAIHRPSDHATAKKLGELKGKKVVGTNGEKLGDLHDFVLDAKSGKIAHAVVSSGGMLGLGDKLRVVSHVSLKSDSDELTVQMDKSAFEALPTVEEKDLKAGKLSAQANSSGQDWQKSSTWTGQQDNTANADASTRTASSAAVGTTYPDATDDSSSARASIDATKSTSSTASSDAASTSTPSDVSNPEEPGVTNDSNSIAATTTQPADVSGATSTASDTTASMHAKGDFVLASELDGKELRAGVEEIGTIEDVAIDLEQGTAMAVVKIKADTAGGDDMFHVPFSNLQIDTAQAASVSTTLARSDFTQATSTSQVSATAPGITNSDDSLTPTGRSSDASTSANASTSSTSTYSSSATPSEEDAASTDSTARGSSNLASSGSTYGNTASSDSAASVSKDAAGASATTEPYGATADSSRTAVSTPSSSMSTTPDYSASSSSTTNTMPSVETKSSTDSRSAASINGSTDATSSSSVAGPGTSGALTTEDEQLTPTGRDHGSDLTSAAAAIRSALNSDQTLASEDVKVQEAGKKIMLQGKVSSEGAKERIETLAKQAAGSAEIDSKLKVKDQE